MKLRRRTIGGSPGSWLTARNRSGEAREREATLPPVEKQRALQLTQLSALAGRLEQQLQLVQDQRHVHSVAAESLHPEQECHRRLELSRQEQHLEIEEGLLAGREMGLSCWEDDRGRVSFGEKCKLETVQSFVARRAHPSYVPYQNQHQIFTFYPRPGWRGLR